jgi:hypothetical protein
VGRTRPIRPTRAAPPRAEPIRADFMHFFAGSGLKSQNPGGSGRFSGLIKFFGAGTRPAPNIPADIPLKKKNPRTNICSSRSLHSSDLSSLNSESPSRLTHCPDPQYLTHCPPATVEQSLDLSLSFVTH